MSKVHDNTIKKYLVDFENERLVIETNYLNDTQYLELIHDETSIVFTGYLTHFFSDEQKNSIIFDIQELDISDFIRVEHEILEKRKDYGWPICYRTPDDFKDELMTYLQTNHYKIFCISSSVGLNGWVIAQKMDFIMG
jgi:hypothetical protein